MIATVVSVLAEDATRRRCKARRNRIARARCASASFVPYCVPLHKNVTSAKRRPDGGVVAAGGVAGQKRVVQEVTEATIVSAATSTNKRDGR